MGKRLAAYMGRELDRRPSTSGIGGAPELGQSSGVLGCSARHGQTSRSDALILREELSLIRTPGDALDRRGGKNCVMCRPVERKIKPLRCLQQSSSTEPWAAVITCRSK